jgi:sugar (pentulose or hexulose) kinase
MVILGIDLGTQSIKAGLIEVEGKVLEVHQESQAVYNPKPGWAQQKPELWWNLTKDVIKKLISKSSIDLREINGIGCCGQMHGPVGLDKNGKVTTEWTQIWMDKRSEDICEDIRESYDESELAKITGNPITTGWPGVKVKWIKENQPKIYNKTEFFLVPKDFINFKLTGVIATDPSEASGTYLYDINKNNYSEEMGKILDIDIQKFAKIFNSYDIIGTLQQSTANDLGLPKNIPIIAGGGDFIVSLLGIGMLDEKTAIDMSGTSTLFVVKKTNPIIHPLVQNLKHVIDGWAPFTMLDCGGLSIAWWKEVIDSIKNNEIKYKEIIDMASEIPIGSNGLIFYPYLLGERRTENINAKGAFFGVSLNHKIAHFIRAIMEGVALAVGKDAKIFKNLGVNIKRVYCLGGATRNRLLSEMKANIMGIPQIITNEPEASLRGVGLLTAYGLEFISNIEEISKSKDSDTEIIKPDEEALIVYKTVLKRFEEIYNRMVGFYEKEFI